MRDQDRSAEPPAGALARTAVPEGHDPVGAARSGPQLKLCPQPQVRWALGLLIENPAWVRPSA